MKRMKVPAEVIKNYTQHKFENTLKHIHAYRVRGRGGREVDRRTRKKTIVIIIVMKMAKTKLRYGTNHTS